MTKNRNLKLSPSQAFETRRPSDYLLRAAGSTAGQVYKSLAIERLGVEEGNAVLDLGCGTGGVLAEPDWRTLLIDHPEPELPEAYRQFVVGKVIRNARIGSELPRLMQHADLELESVTPVTVTYTDAIDADRIFGFARVTRRAVKAGHLTPEQASRWLGHLEGPVFFASLTIFVTAARSHIAPEHR